MKPGSAACFSLLALLAPAACVSGPEPVFPADYATSFVEVRACRQSGDHDLHHIRILASPDAASAYLGRGEPFAEGAVVLKEEHDFADDDCTRAPTRWTAMRRLPSGSSPATMDWRWQALSRIDAVETQDEARCISCHEECGIAPDGFGGTCAAP